MSIDGSKECKECRVVKPIEDFYKHANCADGRLGMCKECKRSYAKAYGSSHREQSNASHRARLLDPEIRRMTNARNALSRRLKRTFLAAMQGPRFMSARHPLYGRYTAMLRRCYNKNAKPYPWYGGRGISVCERWRSDFKAFVSDMGIPSDMQLQLDRIDNDGNYSPDNCKWSTRSENCLNRRPKGSCNVT